MDAYSQMNSLFLFLVVGIIMAYVLFQAIVFMRKGWNEALRLGIEKNALKRIVRSAVSITIIPSIQVLLVLIVLVPILGIPLPWLRLSVIGAATFEMMGAQTGIAAAGGSGLVSGITLEQFVSAAWVMSIAGSVPLLMNLFVIKPVAMSLERTKHADRRWVGILSSCAMCGLLGFYLVDNMHLGLVAVMVVVVCLLFSILLAAVYKKTQKKWLQDLMLPIVMIFGLAAALFITNVLHIGV